MPKDWSATTNNGFTHIRDENGTIRIRIDPPDNKTPYAHKHFYDHNGKSVDVNGNPVKANSPDAHIPLK